MLKDLSSTRNFTIRDAKPSDGEFIARNVLAGMGYEVFNGDGSGIEFASATLTVGDAVKVFGEVCARPDTLYSYTRTRVACVDGKAVGSLTAYSGDDYLPLRERTWGLLNSAFASCDDASSEGVVESATEMPSAEPECLPGEFYLDSMAILPEYRRLTFEYSGSTDRIGHLLMLDGIEAGRRKGLPRISLIVDKTKPRLNAYYAALGFRPDGEILFFGHLYDRMVKDID